MILSAALAHHQGALRASLRAEYGIDLRVVRESRSMPVGDLADLIVWLPPGCAFWKDVGGPAAISEEAGQLSRVVYWLQVLDYRERGGKGAKPKPDPVPPYAHERRAAQDANARKFDARMRRQRAKGVGGADG